MYCSGHHPDCEMENHQKQVDTAHEHVEMNTNDAYMTNAVEVANVAYVTADDSITATQNVAYGKVPPGTDDYDYL